MVIVWDQQTWGQRICAARSLYPLFPSALRMKDISLKLPTRKGIKGVVRGGKDWGYIWESICDLLHRNPHINQLSRERKYHIFVQSSIYHLWKMSL